LVHDGDVDRKGRKGDQWSALGSVHLSSPSSQYRPQIIVEVEKHFGAINLREVQRSRRPCCVALALNVCCRQLQQLVIREDAGLDLVEREARGIRRGGLGRGRLRGRRALLGLPLRGCVASEYEDRENNPLALHEQTPLPQSTPAPTPRRSART